VKIFWDLDGVLRDLCTPIFGHEPSVWHHINEQGKDAVDIIEADLCILATAPPTEYFDYVVQNHAPIHLVTHQKEHWRPFTIEWFKQFLDIPFIVNYVRPEHKLDFVGEGNYIVEDYPMFSDYSKVILVDRMYNRHIKSPIRVRNIKELEDILKNKK
jgi:hypothetical protein